jgi:fatty acid-binding protein DegV
LGVSDMVRTRRKSLERIVAKIKDQYGDEAIKVAIVHSQDPSTAEMLKEMMEPVLNITETIFTELSISVAANLGPKTVGIVALPDKI